MKEFDFFLSRRIILCTTLVLVLLVLVCSIPFFCVYKNDAKGKSVSHQNQHQNLKHGRKWTRNLHAEWNSVAKITTARDFHLENSVPKLVDKSQLREAKGRVKRFVKQTDETSEKSSGVKIKNTNVEAPAHAHLPNLNPKDFSKNEQGNFSGLGFGVVGNFFEWNFLPSTRNQTKTGEGEGRKITTRIFNQENKHQIQGHEDKHAERRLVDQGTGESRRLSHGTKIQVKNEGNVETETTDERRVKRSLENSRPLSLGDLPINTLSFLSGPSPASTYRLQFKSFIDKHVSDGHLVPNFENQGGPLVKSLRQKLQLETYARPFQSILFPKDSNALVKVIEIKAKKVLAGNAVPQMVAIENKPYHKASADLKLANPNYDTALQYLEANTKQGVKNPATLTSLQQQGPEGVQKLLDRTLGSVVFEIRDPIVLTSAETGKKILVERIGGDPTAEKVNTGSGSGTNGNQAEKFRGWGLSDVQDEHVNAILYTKVKVPAGTLISDIDPNNLKIQNRDWELHFDTDNAAPPSSSSSGQKQHTYRTKPAFTEIDELNAEGNLITAKRDAKRKESDDRHYYINKRKIKDDEVKKHVDTISAELDNELNVLKAKADAADAAAGASEDQIKKRKPTAAEQDLKERKTNLKKIITNLDKDTLKLDLDASKLDLEQFEHQKKLVSKQNEINAKARDYTSNKNDWISDPTKKRHNIPTDQKINRLDFTIDSQQNLLTKKIILLEAQLKYVEAVHAQLPTAELDNLQSNVWSAEKDHKAVSSTFKTDKNEGDILDLKTTIKTRTDEYLDAGCDGDSSGRRKRAACSPGRRKSTETVKVEITGEKLERKMRKREKFKMFVKNLFPTTEKKGSVDSLSGSGKKDQWTPAMTLESVVKSRSLRNKFKGSGFVQGFLGLREVEQAFVGPKTIQKALAPNKKLAKARARVAKVSGKFSGAMEKANYAFLVRDFTKAAIQGDATAMVIMGSMTGVQIASTVLAKVATRAKLLGMAINVGKTTAKAMMAVSRLAGAGLAVVGAGFDIYGIVNSGQCLAQKSENTALCRQRDPKCQMENEICEGRDGVFDIVTKSISLAGAAATIVASFIPVVGPIISIAIAIFTFALTVVSEVYQANKYLDNFEKDIPLYKDERLREVGRRLIGQNVTDYLLELKEQKRVNSQQLENIRQFLVQNSDTFWAAFFPALDPTGVAYLDNVVKVRAEDYGLKSFTRWSADPNRMVEGAKIHNFDDDGYFCRPVGESPESSSTRGPSYYCHNAMGFKTQNKINKGLFAYFNLEKGTDTIIGFERAPNYFDVQSGYKNFSGGLSHDLFVVKEKFSGFLNGGSGQNTLRISDTLSSSSVEIRKSFYRSQEQTIQIDGESATLKQIQNIQGRSNNREVIYATCSTQTLDGAGGQDEIYVERGLSCPSSSPINLRITVRPGLIVTNDFEGQKGTFLYHLLDGPAYSGGSALQVDINIRASSTSSSSNPEHQFVSSSRMENLKITWSWVRPQGHSLEIQDKSVPFLITFRPSSSSSKAYEYKTFIQTGDGFTMSFFKDASATLAQLNVRGNEIKAQQTSSTETSQNYVSTVVTTTSILKIRGLKGDAQSNEKKFELEIHFKASFYFNSRSSTISIAVLKDGATLLLTKKEGKLTPVLRFTLSQLKFTDDTGVLRGNLWSQNIFQISNPPPNTNTNIRKIYGGQKDDHFLLEKIPPGLQSLSSGSSGLDTIELGKDLKSKYYKATTDLNKKLIEFHGVRYSNMKLELEGSFENYLGLEGDSDELVVCCSSKFVDLRGGGSDLVIIPNFRQPCPDDGIELQIHVWPRTTVKNFYGHSGSISYIVQSSASFNSVVGAGSKATIEIQSQSTSLKNYVQLAQTSAADVKNIEVKISRSNSVILLEQFLQISFPTGKIPQIITKDAAAILLLQPSASDAFGTGEKNSGQYKPTFYFDLNAGYHGNRNIQGNQIYPNYFNLVNGTLAKIKGGGSDDRFVLGMGIKCDEISSGNGGVDIIETFQCHRQRSFWRSIFTPVVLAQFSIFDFDLDFHKKVINFATGSTCNINGDSFRHMIGSDDCTEKVTVSPSVLSVDLKGGLSPTFPDVIIIPRNENLNWTKYNLTIALRNNIHVISEGQHGSTTYHFQSGSGLSEVTFKNPTAPHQNVLALDFLARHLEISVSKNSTLIKELVENKSQLKLNVNPLQVSDSFQILCKEQAQIIFMSDEKGNKFDAGFKFILTESLDNVKTRGKNIQGGKFNPNFFLISGIYNTVVGGEKGDKFIIGPDSQVKFIESGNHGYYKSEDGLEFDDSVDGQLSIDLSRGFFSRIQETVELKTGIKGNFGHVRGRRSGSEILITNSKVKTINLQGTENDSSGSGSGETDLILIPENGVQDEKYNILIDYHNSDQLLLFNGARAGQFVYNVETPSGKFQLFNLYDPYENSNPHFNAGQREKGHSAKQEFNVQESFHLSSVSFFHVTSLEADPASNTIKFQIQIQDQNQFSQDDDDDDGEKFSQVSFSTRHFSSYERLLKEFEWRVKCKNSNSNIRRNCSLLTDETEEESEDNSADFSSDSDLEAESEPELVFKPPIKFPTFTTSDDYKIFINHLGGIHAVTSIPLSTFSDPNPDARATPHIEMNLDMEKIAGQVINQHLQIVNDLGISLIISLFDDRNRNRNPNSEMKTIQQMIFMGGDDETDSLMNHPSLPSHLVGNAGGEENFFVILATQNQAPVYLYLPQATIQKPVSCSIDESNEICEESSPDSTDIPDPDPAPVNVLNLAGFFDRPLRPYEFPDDAEDDDQDDQDDQEDGENTGRMKNSTTANTEFEESTEKVSKSEIIRKPKILIPEIIQKGDSDLRILVKYLQDPYDHESRESTQEIVFVGGVEDYKKLSVRLYVATYRIKKEKDTDSDSDYEEWLWSLVPEKLVLPPSTSLDAPNFLNKDAANENKGFRKKRQTVQNEKSTSDNNDNDNDNDSATDLDRLPMSSGIKYVFFSHSDLFEYLDFGIPIQLDRMTKALDGPKSCYRNGESLVITNKVDVDPSLTSADIWGSNRFGSDSDEEGSASSITIVLLDIKEPMEQENFTVTIKSSNSKLKDSCINPDPMSPSPSPSPDVTQDFTISFDSIHQLQDYSEAVQEMEGKKEWNRKVGMGILILLILFTFILILLLCLFILCKFLGKQQFQLQLDCFNCLGGRRHRTSQRFLGKPTQNQIQGVDMGVVGVADNKNKNKGTFQEMELDSLLQSEKLQEEEEEEWDVKFEYESTRQEMRCQKYWFQSHRWIHWQQLKEGQVCFCQSVSFVPAWRIPVPVPVCPNEHEHELEHNSKDRDNAESSDFDIE